ncbi:MAG: hypothetical protein FWH37_03400 [Candidatus Bathyarchaeota archaeon]|nr:hypothetical protein [Candidatus Termiticorpusculum sp.]
MEWNATLVDSSAKFEHDHPEMVTNEIVNMFNSQPTNTSKNSQPLVLENNKQTVETPD